jgi:dimethylargininase
MLLRRSSNSGAAPTAARLLWGLLVSGALPHPPRLHARAYATTTPIADDVQSPPIHPPAPTFAIVRAVSRAFADAIASTSPVHGRIDAERAAEQHARYLSVLREAASSSSPPLRLVELDAPDDLPDACFVEDTAVVVPGAWLPRGRQAAATASPPPKAVAVVARPPAPSRAREPEAVARALRGHPDVSRAVEVVGEIAAPGTLDGGDVLILPPADADADADAGADADADAAPTTTVLVGLSERTNAAGAAQLRDLLAPRGVRVVPVPLAAALARAPGLQQDASSPPHHFRPLHLKSAVTALSADVLLCADGPAGRAIAAAVHGALLRAGGSSAPAAAARSAAAPVRLPTFAFLPEADAGAANVLLLGDAVVAQPSAPEARAVLEFLCGRLNRRLVLLDPPLTEMQKADGALTCCSILF